MDNLHLVTGFLGREHITAADQGAFNAALIGTGQFVLEKGKVFEAQVISNNLIRVLDGELMMQGRFVRLAPNDYADLAIENGEKGLKRNDLIVVRYTKDTLSGIESVNLVVIKGEAVEGEPVDPAFTESDITNGEALLHEFPLWRIPIDGLNVGEPVALYGLPFIDSMQTLHTIREDINAQIAEQNAQYEAAFEEQNSKFQKAVDGFGGYTKTETLSPSTKTALGLSEDATPDDAFKVVAQPFKVGDTLTTLRTDLDDNWLLCNGEAIVKSEYETLTSLLQDEYASHNFAQGGEMRRVVTLGGYWFCLTKDDNVIYVTDNPYKEWRSVEFSEFSTFGALNVAYDGNVWAVAFAKNGGALAVAYTSNPFGEWTIKELGKYSATFYQGDFIYADGKWVIGCPMGSDYQPYVIYAETIEGNWTEKSDRKSVV